MNNDSNYDYFNVSVSNFALVLFFSKSNSKILLLFTFSVQLSLGGPRVSWSIELLSNFVRYCVGWEKLLTHVQQAVNNRGKKISIFQVSTIFEIEFWKWFYKKNSKNYPQKCVPTCWKWLSWISTNLVSMESQWFSDYEHSKISVKVSPFQVSTLPRLIQWAIQRNLDQDSWAIADQGWRARSVVTIFEISRRCKNGGRTQDFHCREIFESSSLLKVGPFLL